MFGRIAETTAERGDFFLFYSYADLAGQLAALAAPSFSHLLAHSVITATTAQMQTLWPSIQLPPLGLDSSVTVQNPTFAKWVATTCC